MGQTRTSPPANRQLPDSPFVASADLLVVAIGTNTPSPMGLVTLNSPSFGNHPPSATHPADQAIPSHLVDPHFTDHGHVPKNGVNTCPPISEYEIINAPKFSAVIMPFSTINAPNLVTDSLNLNNSDPILPQTPRNPQLPKRAFPF